jgi:DUF218 domain
MAMRPPTPRGAKRRSLWVRMLLWIYFPALLVLAGLFILLWKSGFGLISGAPLERASWAFVLPGETSDCEATDAAAKAFEEGRIDTLVVLGSRSYKSHWQTEWAREYLERRGLPADRIFEMRLDANSTLDVARQLVRLARLQNLDTLHLIVSNFQSRRMQRLYSKLAGGLPIVAVHPIETPSMRASSWWSTPQSQFLWLSSWMGTLHTWAITSNLKADLLEAEVRNLTPDIWTIQDLRMVESPTEGISKVDTSLTSGLLDSAARILDSLKGTAASEANDSGKSVDTVRQTDPSEDKPKSDAKSQPKSDSKSELKADSKSESKSKSNAKSETKSDSKSDSKSNKDTGKDAAKKSKAKK